MDLFCVECEEKLVKVKHEEYNLYRFGDGVYVCKNIKCHKYRENVCYYQEYYGKCHKCYFYDKNENPCDNCIHMVNDGKGFDYFLDKKDMRDTTK